MTHEVANSYIYMTSSFMIYTGDLILLG